MKMQLLGALLALSITTPALAAIKEEPVTYRDGETTMKGTVVYDTAKKDRRPGIVMVHEWWGITKHMHNEARGFARQGYTVFIADMYGDAKTADNPKDAGVSARSVAASAARWCSTWRAPARTLRASPASTPPWASTRRRPRPGR